MSTPLVDVAKLTHQYPPRKPALSNVSFQIEAGECVGVVGPNGAGKTTLFLCLGGILIPQSGRITVAGLNPAVKSERKKIPTQLGIVFQKTEDQLLHSTVHDDVAFGPLNLDLPRAEVEARVEQALARVGMSDQGDQVPFHLSGGEQRRVAIAGVLAMRPKILLLDEPSSDLDPRGRRQLIEILRDLSEVTQLIATHDLELILETCDRCLLLDGGELIAESAPRELLSNLELMEEHGLEVPYSLRHA